MRPIKQTNVGRLCSVSGGICRSKPCAAFLASENHFRFAPRAAACGLNMSEWRADFELLEAFSRQGDQQAFATLTRRHLDLVYATALRKVTDDGAAEEICQNVFGTLARKAWQFAPDDSLPSWLHRTTLLEGKSWLRGELRRRRREQAAAELGTTMKTPDEQPAFNALVPLLDEALLSLRDKDRTALLLRYHESQSLRDVGLSLGTSEDAARKRVGAALEKLSQFFQRRGFKTATVAATVAVLQHTAAAAPSSVAGNIITISCMGVSAAGKPLLLLKLMSMTKLQFFSVAVLTVTTAIVPLRLEQQRNNRLLAENKALQSQVEQVKALEAETTRLHTATPDHSAIEALQQERTAHEAERKTLLALRSQVGAARRKPGELENSDERRRAQEGAMRQLQFTNVPPDQIKLLPLEGRIELGSVAGVGAATPESTLQSYVFAVMQQDYESWLNLKFTPEYRAAFGDVMDNESFQKVLATEKEAFAGVKAIKLLSKEVRGDFQVGLHFEFEFERERTPDAPLGGALMMTKVGEEWKVVITSSRGTPLRPRKATNQ